MRKGVKKYYDTLMSASYDATSRTHRTLKEWNPQIKDADSELAYERDTLISRSRDIVRNNAVAKAVFVVFGKNVIGPGLTFQSRIQNEILGLEKDKVAETESQIEREWESWSDSVDCSMSRDMTFKQMQLVVFHSALESGDCFGLLPSFRRPGDDYSLKVQLIEADRVCNKFGTTGDRVAEGIERDVYGGIKQYHIKTVHPGNSIRAFSSDTTQWKTVRAFGKDTGLPNVLHVCERSRPNQTRGVPVLAQAIISLKNFEDYVRSELVAANVASAFTGFIKTPQGVGFGEMKTNDGETRAYDPDETYMSPGSLLKLLPGDDVSFGNPGRPNPAVGPFLDVIGKLIGASVGIPWQVVMATYDRSYSAGRSAQLDAWGTFLGHRMRVIEQFNKPVFKKWFFEAVTRGKINAPGFLGGSKVIQNAYLNGMWNGPTMPSVNPVQDVTASKMKVAEGFSTVNQESAKYGSDGDANHRQRVKENDRRISDRLIKDETQ